MNLTQRDKKLLIALGIVVFVVVFLKFLFFPKLNNINGLKADIENLNDSYATNMAYKAKVQSLDSDIKILSKKLGDLRKIYPPNVNSDELLVLVKDLTNKSKLEVKSISFGTAGNIEGNNTDSKDKETQNPESQKEENSTDNPANDGSENGDGSKLINGSTSDIQNYFYLWGLKSKEKGNDGVGIADGKGYSVSVKLDATGTNDQIKTFFEMVAKLPNKALCKTVSISPEQANGQGDKSKQNLKLNAEIVFYGIRDKGAEEYKLLDDGKWFPIPANGKKDIFKSYTGFSASLQQGGAQKTASSANKKSDEKKNGLADVRPGTYDFSIVASYFGGGLAPSVSINCENPALPANSNAVVYGDNKDIENAEIFIEQKGGKYFCKFRTQHESYPDKEYSQTMEFVPVGEDLKLVILSSKRENENDKAGLKLNIINNTDKQLDYHVYLEDPESPRVQIGKTVGNVVKK